MFIIVFTLIINRMNQQRAGGLLGQGVYGCAFTPALVCKNKNTNNPNNTKKNKQSYVGKLTIKEDAEHEYEISQVLKELPYAKEYFVLINDICTLKPRTKQKNTNIDACKLLDTENISDVHQLIMPFGGTPLSKIESSLKIYDFIHIGQQILEAGTLLLLGKIVHGDLHSMNLLIDEKGQLRIIDFGLAWMPEALTLSNIYLLDRRFQPHITQQSPECVVISGLQEKNTMEFILASMAERKLAMTLIYKLTGLTLDKQLADLEVFTRSSESFRKMDLYSFYKIYWSKIDAWAYGCLLLTLFTNSIVNNLWSDKEMNSKYNVILNCILGLCEMDPGKRLNAVEALEIWAPNSKILELPEVQELLMKSKNIRREFMNKIGTQ